MIRTRDFLRRLWRGFLIILGLLMVAGLGFVDYMTGPEISFAAFYLVPIFLVAWFTGGWAGVVLSIASAISWLLTDIWTGARYSHWTIPYWNAATRFIFFVAVASLLAALRVRLTREVELARTDGLTGVANVRCFLEMADKERSRSRRYNRPFTLVYIDLDDFKRINDFYGHNTGDILLRLLAETMRDNVRRTDIVARLGGDEFAVLLPETGFASAKAVVGKLRLRLLGIVRRRGLPVTFSMGVVTFVYPPESVGEMIRQADDLMYAAKRSGKDAVKYKIWGRSDARVLPWPKSVDGDVDSGRT